MGILNNLKGLTGGGVGGSILEDAFGYDTTLLSYLDYIFTDNDSSVIKFFNQQLYRDFAPDINGYTMLFLVPPDLSGYRCNLNPTETEESEETDTSTFFGKATAALNNANQWVKDALGLNTDPASFDADSLYSQTNNESFMNQVSKIITFAGVDFTPPQSQINADSISARSGRITYATEVTESDQCSVTYVDNSHLDIYMMHHIWLEYIREVLEGTIQPDPSYYIKQNVNSMDMTDSNYGTIDYAASLYIVKYRPDLKTITFVAKCVGIFPQSLPSKELIGTRTANEMTTLTFNYFCTGYREALYTESGGMYLSTDTEENENSITKYTSSISGNWIFSELNDVFQKYQTSGQSPMFGGFLGGVINRVIGPANGMLNNLTGNAAKIGGVVGNVTGAGQSTLNTVKGISKGDYSSIFSYNGPNPFNKQT